MINWLKSLVCMHKWYVYQRITWNCMDFGGWNYQKLMLLLRCENCGIIKKKTISG